MAKLLAAIDAEGPGQHPPLRRRRGRHDRRASRGLPVAGLPALSRSLAEAAAPQAALRVRRAAGALARIMRPGARFCFASDIDHYVGWTLARLLARRICAGRRAARTTGAAFGLAGTRYEAKALREGRTPATSRRSGSEAKARRPQRVASYSLNTPHPRSHAISHGVSKDEGLQEAETACSWSPSSFETQAEAACSSGWGS